MTGSSPIAGIPVPDDSTPFGPNGGRFEPESEFGQGTGFKVTTNAGTAKELTDWYATSLVAAGWTYQGPPSPGTGPHYQIGTEFCQGDRYISIAISPAAEV